MCAERRLVEHAHGYLGRSGASKKVDSTLGVVVNVFLLALPGLVVVCFSHAIAGQGLFGFVLPFFSAMG